jgi:RNA polymerase sigma-70 factor (ECF subfamily)
MVRDEELRSLQGLIVNLKEKEQDLIYLRYVAGLSYAEIGEILNKNTGAVKKSIYRLLARLKSQME